MPDQPHPPTRRGGLFAGLRAGARGFWRAWTSQAHGKSPRVIQKVIRSWGLLATAPLLCSLIILIYASKTRLANLGVWLPPYFLCIAAFVAIQFLILYKIRRMLAHAASLGYRICPECGYSLLELAAAGNCPECGTAYTPEQLAATWEKRWRV